jgi:hypothetical protein
MPFVGTCVSPIEAWIDGQFITPVSKAFGSDDLMAPELIPADHARPDRHSCHFAPVASSEF